MKHFQKYNEELLFKIGKKILTVGENALRMDHEVSRHSLQNEYVAAL